MKQNYLTRYGFSTLTIVSGFLMLYEIYLVFMVVPNERLMGPVQRIFYFHVGAAMACYCAAAVILIGSLGYLALRDARFDILMQAASEVAFLFAAMVMSSGMIWGHAAWNTWFRWEPRLVTFLILLLIFLGLILLRVFGDKTKLPEHCAVLGILGAITVPIVVFSIQLLPSMAQLHPQVVGNRGLRDPLFYEAMFVGMAAMIIFQFQLIWLRYKIGLLETRKLQEIQTYSQP